MNNQVLHTVWCNIFGEAAGEIWNCSPLGVKGLKFQKAWKVGRVSVRNKWRSFFLNGTTVEPRYVELGYLELPALELNWISLGFALVFSVIYYELSRTRISRNPAISNCFSLPLAQINPSYLQLYYGPKKHWSTSVRKCSQGTSWQDVLKAENVLTCSW